MRIPSLAIVYEDPELLVVNKPPGVGSMPMSADAPCLTTLARAYLEQAGDPRPAFVGMAGRLDLPVSGLVVMAKTPAAAAHLTRQYRERTIVKTYRALVSGCVRTDSGRLRHWLRKGGGHAKVRVVANTREGAQEARLAYRVLQRFSRATLLELCLLTGRKHQIRVQLSHEGHPIWGDYKYGSRRTFPRGIALLAQRVDLRHPLTERSLVLSVPTPDFWPADPEPISRCDPTWLKRGADGGDRHRDRTGAAVPR